MIRYWKVTAVDAHGKDVWWHMTNHANYAFALRLAKQECEAHAYTFKRIELFK